MAISALGAITICEGCAAAMSRLNCLFRNNTKPRATAVAKNKLPSTPPTMAAVVVPFDELDEPLPLPLPLPAAQVENEGLVVPSGTMPPEVDAPGEPGAMLVVGSPFEPFAEVPLDEPEPRTRITDPGPLARVKLFAQQAATSQLPLPL